MPAPVGEGEYGGVSQKSPSVARTFFIGVTRTPEPFVGNGLTVSDGDCAPSSSGLAVDPYARGLATAPPLPKVKGDVVCRGRLS